MKNRVVLAAVLLIGGVSLAQAQCGEERWPAKTLTGADTALMNWTPLPITIKEIGEMPKESVGFDDPRLPSELQVYQVDAQIIAYKIEPDSDIHLILKDLTSDSVMVSEVPSENCPDVQGSTHASAFSIVRQWIRSTLGRPTTKFKTVDPPVTVRVEGPLFQDVTHGQSYMLANTKEIHPLLSVSEVASVSEPSFARSLAITPNPAKHIIHIAGQFDRQPEEIAIYGIKGSKEIEIAGSATDLDASVNIRALPNGIHALRITVDGKTVTRWFVVNG